MDAPGIRRKQYGFKSNAHQGAVSSISSGKRKGKASAAAGGGAKKQPIKVVFIGNPVRVTTSEAGFRALVQELTGRHADPYKYSGGGSSGGAASIDADDSSGGSPVDTHHQAGAVLLPSPVSTPSSDGAASAAGAAQVSVPAYDYDDDSFAPQLIDNSYSVFSPPTFL